MYTAFASVYDRLMADVDYLAWARFYHELMERYGVPRGKVCECACGTGSITIQVSLSGDTLSCRIISGDSAASGWTDGWADSSESGNSEVPNFSDDPVW